MVKPPLPSSSILPSLILVALIFFMVGCQAQTRTPVPVIATSTSIYPPVPYELISEESLFGYLEGLTSIQPYSGWRNSGSSGEAEALDYFARQLDEFSNLKSNGLKLERQSYKIFITSELWEARLRLTVQGQEIEVPANGLRGARYDPQLALSLDSDGKGNDSERNPVSAAGLPLLVRDTETFNALTFTEVKDRILFLDYALIDTVLNPDYPANGKKLMKLINLGLDGIVLVTHYSNTGGESRGTFVGDGGVFQYFDHIARIPILHARLEDLAPAGIQTWGDLARIETARLTWDADIFIPGQGGNLIAHLPGRDSSRAVILTAHVDSPNSPGVFDDGSGSAILLEVARVLNVSQAQPAVDLYLVWFGGHELQTYGSAHFVSTHQELLDQTIAMLGIDGAGYALNGKTYEIGLSYTSYNPDDREHAPWPDFIRETMADSGFSLRKQGHSGSIADNSNFDAFNVPSINLDYLSYNEFQTRGSAYIHYASHWHDPYETIDLARTSSATLLQMNQVALAVALETGRTPIDFRITPRPERRALFVATHTESATVAPGMLRELGMALALEGFDVDLLPYGQPLTPEDLENVGLIVLLPTLDYPGPNFEAWSQAEFDLLTDYVAQGGFLIVTNCAYNLASTRQLEDINEDATDFNGLLEPIGIQFFYGNLGGGIVRLTADHPLAADAKYLTSVYEGLQVPMTQQGGLALAPGVIGLADYGSQGGQVLAIADLGLLRNNADGAKNMNFVKNIAQYARSR